MEENEDKEGEIDFKKLNSIINNYNHDIIY